MPQLVRPFRVFGISLAAGALGLSSLSAAPDVVEFDQNGERWSVTILAQQEPAEETDVVITPARQVGAADPAAEGETDIVITPARQVEAADPFDGEPPAPPAPETAPPENGQAEELPSDPKELAALYESVYQSIPYSRSEWEANPGYRHDATMELLTGNPRPPFVSAQAAAPYAPFALSGAYGPVGYGYGLGAYPYGGAIPYGHSGYYDFSRGPYSLYQRLFGYEGGWRTQFYVNGGYGVPYAPWW